MSKNINIWWFDDGVLFLDRYLRGILLKKWCILELEVIRLIEWGLNIMLILCVDFLFRVVFIMFIFWYGLLVGFSLEGIKCICRLIFFLKMSFINLFYDFV